MELERLTIINQLSLYNVVLRNQKQATTSTSSTSSSSTAAWKRVNGWVQESSYLLQTLAEHFYHAGGWKRPSS